MIIVNRSFDIDDIHKTMLECLEDIAEDGVTYLDINIDVDKDCWVSIRNYGVIVGYVQFKIYSMNTMEVHPFIKKKHRQLSKIACEHVRDWFNQCSPKQFTSMVTRTADFNKHIKIFLGRLGFKHIGTFRKAYLKDNINYDLLLYQYMRETL